MKRAAGTVMVTSVGMFGSGAAWGIPVASHTVNVTIGSVVVRPEISNQVHVERREHLCLTVSFDHDIVDGAPAARFIHRLRRILEHPDRLAFS
jgi:pyruvate/2-oxoglutarate dehydrogenase complex dihydrolipoamide acyltransferase (E2) component